MSSATCGYNGYGSNIRDLCIHVVPSDCVELPSRQTLRFCSSSCICCLSAIACAQWIEDSYQAELDAGATDFSAVHSEGRVVTVEYDLGVIRADCESGQVEDGRTLARWADDELVFGSDEACSQRLDHRDFIRMGGIMIHRYQFSDGEVLRAVIIDECP